MEKTYEWELMMQHECQHPPISNAVHTSVNGEYEDIFRWYTYI